MREEVLDVSIIIRWRDRDAFRRFAAGHVRFAEPKRIIGEQRPEGCKIGNFLLTRFFVPKRHFAAIKKWVLQHGGIIQWESSPWVSIINLWPWSVFEFITRMREPSPHYWDPTPIFAVSFPVIFGMMFADPVDGLALITVGLIKHHEWWSPMLLAMGISSFLLGLAFEGFHLFETPVNFLMLSWVVGVLHLLAACYTLYRQGKHTRAVGSALVLLGITALALNLWVAGALILGGALIIAKENLIHLTTITEIFARLLSYSRIFAIGISHYTLLHIIPFPWGHLLTLTLEFMMAFIHDLRLHVVEFASIGLEGGARWFEVKP